MSRRKQKCFTLIELLVVIAMMAITTRSSMRVNLLSPEKVCFSPVLRLKDGIPSCNA